MIAVKANEVRPGDRLVTDDGDQTIHTKSWQGPLVVLYTSGVPHIYGAEELVAVTR
jgi:hypothetical protein